MEKYCYSNVSLFFKSSTLEDLKNKIQTKKNLNLIERNKRDYL